MPEVIEDFFWMPAKFLVFLLKCFVKANISIVQARFPHLWQIGDELEKRFGNRGMSIKRFVLIRNSERDSTVEWVTPGHPLFETVREDILRQVSGDMKRGRFFTI